MSSEILIRGHEYYEKVLYAEQSAAEYRASAEAYDRQKLRSAQRARIQVNGVVYGPAYQAWMCRRRELEYRNFVFDQQTHLHRPAINFNGNLVCTCGLLTRQAQDGLDFLVAPGHIAAGQELEFQFVIYEVNPGRDPYLYFCQGCQAKQPVARNADDDISLKGLALFQIEHWNCCNES